jgi:excisionase family DNA binding protein
MSAHGWRISVIDSLPLQKLLHTKRDAATLLSISLRTVDTLIAVKELKPIRIGRRVLISDEELRKFCKSSHPELN